MLTIETELPIAILRSDEGLGGSDGILDPTANLRLLHALNLFAGGSRLEHGDTPSVEASHDIARLEAKIDMLMLMMGSLVAEKSVLPPVRPLSFNAESITVPCADDYQIGDKVLVALYPSAELPRPLVFPALVVSLVPGSDSISVVTFELGPIDAAVRDEFERYVFLRHRRELAAGLRRKQ